MDIPLDAQVHCTDGPGGETTAVVLKPASEEVTHIVIREPGLLSGSVMVPIEYLVESGPTQVQIRLSRAELTAMPTFAETDMVTPPPGYAFAGSTTGYPSGGAFWPNALYEESMAVIPRSVPPGEITLEHGDVVEAADGRVGRVDELLIDPKTNVITHLVMREGHLWDTREVTIPVTNIDHVEGHAVYLTLTKDQIESLPERSVYP